MIKIRIMGKLKFFGLLLAAGMFAACSDNLDVNQESGAGGGDKTPAYLTISIANSGNSSRANTGTDDGTAEDSELDNAGTANENKVSTILLVALSEDRENGIAKLYTKGTGGSVSDWTNDNNNTYTTDETLKLAVGKYKILVVANPYANFVSEITKTTETTQIAEVRALYDKIINGKYVSDKTTADDAAAVLATVDNGVMMANKAEVEVELEEDNTPDNPETAIVEVERAVSKITFRKKAATDGMGDNVYKVPVSTGTVKAKTVQGKIPADGSGSTEVTLNVANDICSPTPNTVYVYIEESTGSSATRTLKVYGTPDQGKDVYRLLEAKTQSDYNSGTADQKKGWYVVENTGDPEKSLKYQFDEKASTTNWYVKIEGYALTNLSKQQNHVRHIGDVSGVSAPFGTLNGNNYLITPYWKEKNEVIFDQNGGFEDGITPDFISKCFYNDLAAVSEESEKLTIAEGGSFKNGTAAATYFRALPTTDENPGEVTGGTGSNPDIGARMAYCFENSTDINHQTHGLSTGISFVARMYSNEACTSPITTLYQYQGYNFTSLGAIGEAFKGNTPQAILDLIKGTKPETKENLKAAGIVKYSDNICYYYTTEIKHFDNGNNNTLGNMEFAIMRNNIYSLAITNISKIGDPIVDPTPGTPNETKEAALKVQVKILPWIVRYNDIEF